jgi:hypothetical protein
VLVLEAPEPERGGNSFFTAGGFGSRTRASTTSGAT